MRLCYGLVLGVLVGCSGSSYGTNPPPPPPPAGPGTTLVAISDYQFSPDSITITANKTVRWTNGGTVAHTVTADGGSFDSGAVGGGGTDPYGSPTPGGFYEKTFTVAGTFTYHCTNHPAMTGVVVVTP